MPESQKDEFDEQNTDTSDRSLEVSNTGLNPTPGVTYICPDCRNLLYSDKLSRQLHMRSCQLLF